MSDKLPGLSVHCFGIEPLSGFLIAALLVAISFPAQAGDEIYQFYRPELDFALLKDIEQKIERARENRNAHSLCVYAGALFYAEHVSGRANEDLPAIGVLREATLIAWQDEDVAALASAKAIWASTFFGPDNPTAAEAIEKFLQDFGKKDGQEQPFRQHDPQLFLMAEEQARLDAIQQLAEQIFGVMIESTTDVENFTAEKDVVVAKLKASLLLGARFGATEVQDHEVHVSVEVSKASIIASMKQALLSQNKKMKESDQARLEKSLKSKYTAVGVGIISEEE